MSPDLFRRILVLLALGLGPGDVAWALGLPKRAVLTALAHDARRHA